MGTTRLLPKRFSVNIETEEEYCEVGKTLDEHGCIWSSGRCMSNEERNYGWYLRQNYPGLNVDGDTVCLSSNMRQPNFSAQDFLEVFGTSFAVAQPEPKSLELLFE